MKQRFGTATAFAIVVGSMVGTGVFTSLGYQLVEFESGFPLMLLWVVGGICAFCGAVSYCELAAAIPRSGGEYTFLGKAFHPSVGFTAGWISFTVGFSAPAALVAMTFGAYINASFSWINPTLAGIGLILVVTALHAYSHRSSGSFQALFTFVKIALIVLFCGAAYVLVEMPQQVSFLPQSVDLNHVVSGGFAVSLIYVNYAYAGWNATTYVTEEFNQPTLAINRALMAGTGTVLILYLFLNGTFLAVAPTDAMKGQIEVGFIAAQYAFGDIGAQLMSLMLAIILISTLSAMILAGPRVLSRIGNDYPVLRWLGRTNRHDVPGIAIATQSALAIVFILSGTFDSILLFAGLLLGMSAFSTVSASIWMRVKYGKPERYRMPFYPLPPIVFLLVTGWAITHTMIERAVEGVFAAIMIAVGLSLYALVKFFNNCRFLNCETPTKQNLSQ
ncbi:MAG: APC family permease [Gammaproteobacteria bacterium]|nr:APC family permease [Gammaproteobacteria bacterium]